MDKELIERLQKAHDCDMVLRLPFDLLPGSTLESPGCTYVVKGCVTSPSGGWLVAVDMTAVHAHTIGHESI